MAELSEQEGVRMAVIGCGHGVLNSIYASVTKAAQLKDWPGVDLVIIGGDFQVLQLLINLLKLWLIQ
jgi:lariat debranching enzyme